MCSTAKINVGKEKKISFSYLKWTVDSTVVQPSAELLYKLTPKISSSDSHSEDEAGINTLNAELNPICYLLALLGAHHFLHVSRIRVKSLTLRLLMSYIYIYIYIYGAPILDVSRSHTTHHSR